MTFSHNKHYTLISTAVKDELQHLLSNTQNTKALLINETEVITGVINNKNIIFVVTGPGVINTAYALTLILEKVKPELIIQTGCAGAFKESGISTGDVGIATCEIDSHIGLEPHDELSSVPSPLPFSIISKNNVEYTNRFPTDLKQSKSAFLTLSENKKNTFKVIISPFITVSTITTTDKRKDALYKAYKPCMESMEGSAAAHLALLYDIPFMEIRSASNIVGKRDKSKWDLPLAFKNCNVAVLEILKNMDEITPGPKK